MIDHVYISVTDLEKSMAFYLEALKPLGWSAFGKYDSASGPEGIPDLHGVGDHAYCSGTAVGSAFGYDNASSARPGFTSASSATPMNRSMLPTQPQSKQAAPTKAHLQIAPTSPQATTPPTSRTSMETD